MKTAKSSRSSVNERKRNWKINTEGLIPQTSFVHLMLSNNGVLVSCQIKNGISFHSQSSVIINTFSLKCKLLSYTSLELLKSRDGTGNTIKSFNFSIYLSDSSFCYQNNLNWSLKFGIAKIQANICFYSWKPTRNATTTQWLSKLSCNLSGQHKTTMLYKIPDFIFIILSYRKCKIKNYASLFPFLSLVWVFDQMGRISYDLLETVNFELKFSLSVPTPNSVY